MTSEENYRRAMHNLNCTALYTVTRIHRKTGELSHLAPCNSYSIHIQNAKILTGPDSLAVVRQGKQDDIHHDYTRVEVGFAKAVCQFQRQIDKGQSTQPYYWQNFDVGQFMEHLAHVLV